MCIYGSPWLFVVPRKTTYTLVDTTVVRFQGAASEDVIASFLKETPTAVANDSAATYTIKTDRTVYDPWTRVFTFEWEPLELLVTRQTPSSAITARFVDTQGRTSARIFVQTDDYFDIEYVRQGTPGTIPWLFCET